jgi:RIO kinase 2
MPCKCYTDADSFFNRDVNCIRRFFRRRFHFEGTTWPLWKDVLVELREQEGEGTTLGDNAAALGAVEEEEEEADDVDDSRSRHGKVTADESEEEASSSTSTRKGQTEPAEAQIGDEAVAEETRPKRVRIDLEVEASGFGRGLQTELERVGP